MNKVELRVHFGVCPLQCELYYSHFDDCFVCKQDCITRAQVEQLNTKHCMAFAKYFVFAAFPVPAK
jgi:hypothetical protein